MAVKIAPEAVAAAMRRYSMPKPSIFDRGVPARLPEAFKKFYEEFSAPSSVPVHYVPEEGKWKRNPVTGQVFPVQNVPIPLKYPRESHKGLWGGEGVILGYKKQRKYLQKSTRWFVPTLHKSVVYSEILDKRLSVVVTKRTISLIVDHKGFDSYILETPERDLKSLLGLKIKKKMLMALFDKTLYPDNPEKREAIYNKYKHHLQRYNKEDLEWYALSMSEAVHKQLDLEDAEQPTPLKHQFRAELIQELIELEESQQLDKVLNQGQSEETTSWLSKMNPFSKKS